MPVLPPPAAPFVLTVPIAIIGAGACGLAAALAAADQGVECVVLERDPVPAGSTALSSGMIPACGTNIQKAKGITDDSVEVMSADIQHKARDMADPDLVDAVCRASGPAVDWLVDQHGVELTLVEGFLYPGHSRLRMHAPPSRQGQDLINSLNAAAERAGIEIMTNARTTDLYAEDSGKICGLRIERPDGGTEDIGCEALILACNGFGGNPRMVTELIPEMTTANYFGHVGNQGEAIDWGKALGAATRDLGAYQGHGSVAHPHGILISWALMMEGGIQVNRNGERFSNEHEGYSEQGRKVMTQPDGLAWNLYDERLHRLGQDFEDYKKAQALGAVHRANDIGALAAELGLPAPALKKTLQEISDCASGSTDDPFGRDFTKKPVLEPPYYGIKVTGALFHTQGGLVIDANARVRRPDGSTFPNLYAGGGAACGVSGPSDWGYLSGNGLLTALTLGRLAGRASAATGAIL